MSGSPETLRFPPKGGIPNHPSIPLLIYRAAQPASAEAFEQTFSRNGWPPAWRYGIYDFVHYHSTAHEVIGVYRGRAEVRFGDATAIWLEAGDAVVIPAGVSHQCLRQEDGFHGVGAYPEGQSPDMLYGRPGERPDADRRIVAVPIPPADPLEGPSGPLVRLWGPAGKQDDLAV